MGFYKKAACALLVSVFFCAPSALGSEFDDYLKNELEGYTQYRDERDAEFVQFLKSQWQEFQAFRGLVRDSRPKPRRIPKAPEPKPVEPEVTDTEAPAKDPEPPKDDLTLVEKIVVPKKPASLPEEPKHVAPVVGELAKPDLPEPPAVEPPKVAPKPVVVPLPVVKKPEPPVQKEGVTLICFGSPVTLEGRFDFPEVSFSSPLKKSIASYWEAMARSEYDDFLSEARATSDAFGFNDWGYHALLFKAGMEVHDGDRDLANLFTWFMSVKSGYDARAGYSDQRVFLLLPSRNRLYGVSYLTIKGTRYYAMTFDGSREKLDRLFTYKASYPRSNRLMDYRIVKMPDLAANMVEKELTFSYQGTPQELHVSYNRALVDYFKNYPQTNIKIYFDADSSRELDYTMVKELKQALEGKNEVEAVNYLLLFVQNAFRYKTDDDQLGKEKYMLPEETLWYPYSDCEDRSFLFAYLVRKVLKLDVVGLNYPGHVATAVRFSDNLSGDYVVSNNRKYMVCDPTYINASVGMAMPRFKRRNPEVVKIRNWQ